MSCSLVRCIPFLIDSKHSVLYIAVENLRMYSRLVHLDGMIVCESISINFRVLVGKLFVLLSREISDASYVLLHCATLFILYLRLFDPCSLMDTSYLPILSLRLELNLSRAGPLKCSGVGRLPGP